MEKKLNTINENNYIKNNSLSSIEFDLISKYVMIRMNRSISQRDLEKLTGISQVTIARIEKNINSATLSTFIRLLDALGYHIELVKNK